MLIRWSSVCLVQTPQQACKIEETCTLGMTQHFCVSRIMWKTTKIKAEPGLYCMNKDCFYYEKLNFVIDNLDFVTLGLDLH